MDALQQFNLAVTKVMPRGDRLWRQRNEVWVSDALNVARALAKSSGTVVFADPPYTKDHYSRMYHVLETLYLYDYPDSRGVGRMRSDRFLSDFSYSARVRSAFRRLATEVVGAGAPLVISYPSRGLLASDQLRQELEAAGQVREIEFAVRHSSLGGSSGASGNEAVEHLYRVDPR